MIEIIQQNEKAEDKMESKLPKNIRQIGNPEKDFRIYMEDYVYTFLHPAQLNGMEQGILPRLLILLGEINHFSNRSCAFISGALQVEGKGAGEDVPCLDERAWRRVHKEMHNYFDGCEIVGWVLDIPGNTLEVTREMEEMHRRNFVSRYQFFFLMDSKEREEAFYIWKEGRLARKEGYFIYYEKNPQMQEYMISRKEAVYGEEALTENVKDTAAQNYRAMMMEKKEGACKQKTGILSYLTSILTVVVLCTVSVILLGNIRKMEDMEQTISVMSYAIESTEHEAGGGEGQVAVESVSGNVLPIKDKDTAGVSLPEAAGAETLEGGIQEASPKAPQQGVAGQEEALGAVAGEPLDVPEETKEPEATPETKEALTDAEIYRAQGYYIVRQGDSLRKICYDIYQTYGMLDALCEANAIEDMDTIFVGQKIVLPK